MSSKSNAGNSSSNSKSATFYHAASAALPGDSIPSDESGGGGVVVIDAEAAHDSSQHPYVSMTDNATTSLGFGAGTNSGPFSGVKAMDLQCGGGGANNESGEIPSTSSSPFSTIIHQLRSCLSHLNTSALPFNSKTITQACYLGIFAMLGTLLRLILAQVFGQACQNPGTIGWIADDAALCVTANGDTSQQGGIIFADLPANILGSFIMGLLQDGAALDLAIHAPLAFLRPSHKLQAYDILHLALKTGFCGSLTTFSGWNSEMVIMLVGTEATHRPSQIWKALLGYVIGIETSIGSYVFGRTVAWWLHQWQNPDLAVEQEAMKVRRYQHGIVINHNLPALERRYLHSLFELPSNGSTDSTLVSDEAARKLSPSETLTPEELSPLLRWRDSTKDARRVESNQSSVLVALETAAFVKREPITAELQNTAMKNGWDIAALEVWLAKRYDPQLDTNLNSAGIQEPLADGSTVVYSVPFAILVWAAMIATLTALMFIWDAQDAYEITYRTMAYSMIYATPGVLLRWSLSKWNGTFTRRDWKWLPIGTLTANVFGAMVSISMIAWDYNLQIAGNSGYWSIATLQAIKIGFSGCLTTVSTFVSEVHKLTNTRQDRGY
ncbi:MAG: hypothetical protein SGILL_002585, partial [Bacillariaceae sp.]